MEIHQVWRPRVSFKNATIALTITNIIALLFLLQGFLSSSSPSRFSYHQLDSAQLKYIKEAEEARLAMQPLELIKRVQEIKQEVYMGRGKDLQHKEPTQNAAIDLSKRLKDFRALNDGASFRALEEWRKRKMERARRRELGKNGTAYPGKF